jgi:BirA family biotin operon repressor/biotin-[acetyl-CoA-carboxylase] ligase
MRIQTYSFNSLENEILWFPSLASTNDTAKELAESGRSEGTCVIADEQTRGRGRQGRIWHSPQEQALYLSLILRPVLVPEKLQLLTIASAVAAAETAKEFLSDQSGLDIKWPNDLLVNERKLCGILVESAFEQDRIKYAIVGIGFNLNQTSFPDDLADFATSLRLQTGKEGDRENFAIRLLNNLDKQYFRLQNGNSKQIIERWVQLSSYALDKAVMIDLGGEQLIGTTCGLTETGALKLKQESGDVIVVNAGEIISLRS